jgi:Uma2 family endonuclease
MKQKLKDYEAMGILEIWVIDPQDSTFYRYEDLQLLRNDTFSHAAKGISFDMNQLKQLLG